MVHGTWGVSVPKSLLPDERAENEIKSGRGGINVGRTLAYWTGSVPLAMGAGAGLAARSAVVHGLVSLLGRIPNSCGLRRCAGREWPT